MNLRAATATALMLTSALSSHAQHPVIAGVLDAMRIDSMMTWVSQLSGEEAVTINGAGQTLLSRHKNNAGNDLAQAWLEAKLVELGYTPVAQPFNATGRNVLATKPGDGSTEEVVIICAHYDAMPGGVLNAPAADDDGSGVCAVLEAARVLRDVPFVHPIVFALWDEEEQGKVGSLFYAGGMAANDALIRGVINMDAIAYDGNGDKKARVHTRPVANSLEIADTVFAMREQYAIDIDLILTNPGATYSDHASFWTEGYGAVLVIEEFSADGNPQYHTPNDRIQYFDVPYYEKLAKLSIAAAAALAVPVENETSVGGIENGAQRMLAFPNPTNGDATIYLEAVSTLEGSVYVLDAMGRGVCAMEQVVLAAGRNSIGVSLAGLPPGPYTVSLTLADGTARAARLVKLP